MVFASPRTERLFDCSNDEAVVVIDAPRITNNPIARFVWLQTTFYKWIKKTKCDIVFNMNNLAGPASVPQILFIQQSRYFSKEALRSYRRRDVPLKSRCRSLFEPFIMRFLYRSSIRKCKRVIVQTEVMKKAVVNQFDLAEKEVFVIPPSLPQLDKFQGPSSHLRPMRTNGWYHWLYVGNSQPYKNLKVVKEVAQMASPNRLNWYFHIVGGDRTNLWDDAKTFFYPYLTREELSEAYSLANALIMPSLTETVGLPMIEAISMKTPVIAADRPYAHEICGPCALYFDPYSAISLYNKLMEIQTNTHNRVEECKNYAKERFSSKRNGMMVWKTVETLLTPGDP